MTIVATTTTAHSSSFGLIWLIVFAVLEIVSIYYSAKIGNKKGYNAVLFGLLGFFFGLIMLVIVFVMPYRGSKTRGAGTASPVS